MYETGQPRSKILAHMQAETMVRKERNTACHNSKQKELNTVPRGLLSVALYPLQNSSLTFDVQNLHFNTNVSIHYCSFVILESNFTIRHDCQRCDIIV